MDESSRKLPRSLLGRAALAAAIVAALGGCWQQVKRQADADALRDSAESFHRLVRWGDLKSASRYLAPERRLEFLKEVIDRGDEENLKVIDYELEDAQMAPGRAVILSKITWHRLPSVTTTTEAMTLTFEDRQGAWAIVAIDGGPLPLAALPAAASTPLPGPSAAH